MRNPTHLAASRHGIFYFRYPIGVRDGKVIALRLSLHTRDPQTALRRARALSQSVEDMLPTMMEKQLSFDEIRSALKAHFSTGLERHIAERGVDGPLAEEQIADFRTSANLYDEMSVDGEHLDAPEHDRQLVSFAKSHGLTIERGTAAYALLKREHLRATRDFFRAIAAHNSSLQTYDFAPEPVQQREAQGLGVKVTLEQLVTAYERERLREKQGTAKTRKERSRHMDLLCEILDGSTEAAGIGYSQSQLVKERLATLPPNRTKKRETRNIPLMDLAAADGVGAIHLRTVNRYLVSYNTMFKWAKRTGYVRENPFDGISFNTDYANDKPPRLPFTVDQLATIRGALLGNERRTLAHHKWGVLLAMHSGARLNEVAQLHLDDIIERDGVPCMDINTNDKETTRKRLKNRHSARIVPLHPKLLEYGFMEYVREMRQRPNNLRLFPELTYSGDGYGRNLGRWFNETLLRDLGIKTKELVFHSLRHSMVDRLIEAETQDAHLIAIVGHEPGTTATKFYNAKGFPPAQLLEALKKIDLGQGSTETRQI